MGPAPLFEMGRVWLPKIPMLLPRRSCSFMSKGIGISRGTPNIGARCMEPRPLKCRVYLTPIYKQVPPDLGYRAEFDRCSSNATG